MQPAIGSGRWLWFSVFPLSFRIFRYRARHVRERRRQRPGTDFEEQQISVYNQLMEEIP